ncbi:unnamed protein product, partial [Rotaria sp. Silwood1]
MRRFVLVPSTDNSSSLCFILSFDPIFSRSLSKLIANPTTDTQQMYYNQIISTLGS